MTPLSQIRKQKLVAELSTLLLVQKDHISLQTLNLQKILHKVWGGAINIIGVETTTVSKCTFTNNQAKKKVKLFLSLANQ